MFFLVALVSVFSRLLLRLTATAMMTMAPIAATAGAIGLVVGYAVSLFFRSPASRWLLVLCLLL